MKLRWGTVEVEWSMSYSVPRSANSVATKNSVVEPTDAPTSCGQTCVASTGSRGKRGRGKGRGGLGCGDG